MTQQQLAELLGVSQSCISEAEVKGTGLSLDNWRRLAAFFNVDQHVLQGLPLFFA